MVWHGRMSAGRVFQVDGAATEKARRTSLVCARGTTSSGASDERRAWVCTGSPNNCYVALPGYQVTEIRWSVMWPALCESVEPLFRFYDLKCVLCCVTAVNTVL